MAGEVIGDPHIRGFEGDVFDFMGDHDKIYNLFSCGTVQINMKIKQSSPSLHDLTHVDAFGLKIGDNRIEMYSHLTELGMLAAKLNNIPITSKKTEFDTGLKNKNNTPIIGFAKTNNNQVHIETGNYKIVLIRRDPDDEVPVHHLNINIHITKLGILYDGIYPHGIVGQTADLDGKPRISEDKNGLGAIDGTYTDYEVSDLFSDDFKFNRFGVPPMTKPKIGVGSKYTAFI